MNDKEIKITILKEALQGMLDTYDCVCDEIYKSGNQSFCWRCRAKDYLYNGKDWNLNRKWNKNE